MKHPGLYVPLDVNYTSDEGIRRAGIAAELIFIRALAYAKRTNSGGYLPDYDLPVIGVGLPPGHIDDAVAALVHWELWVPEDGGWRIRSWERWNSTPDAAEADRKRAAARERKRRQREREAAAKKAAEEAAEVAPGQLKLVVPEGTGAAPNSGADVTRDITRDGHEVTPPKRREEKRSTNYSPSPAGEAPDSGEPPAPKKPTPGSDDDPEWLTFWDRYPHKVSKKKARTAFARARKTVAFDHLMVGLDRYLTTDPRVAKGFIKDPTTWLNGSCWDDQPSTAPATTPTHANTLPAADGTTVFDRARARFNAFEETP